MNHEVVIRVAVAGVLVTFVVVSALLGLRYRKSWGKAVSAGRASVRIGKISVDNSMLDNHKMGGKT